MPIADLEISIDGRQLFHREMSTGTQHNWEQITAFIASGEHTLLAREVKTETRKSELLNIERELWIVVTFSNPPPQLGMAVFDRPVSMM